MKYWLDMKFKNIVFVFCFLMLFHRTTLGNGNTDSFSQFLKWTIDEAKTQKNSTNLYINFLWEEYKDSWKEGQKGLSDVYWGKLFEEKILNINNNFDAFPILRIDSVYSTLKFWELLEFYAIQWLDIYSQCPNDSYKMEKFQAEIHKLIKELDRISLIVKCDFFEILDKDNQNPFNQEEFKNKFKNRLSYLNPDEEQKNKLRQYEEWLQNQESLESGKTIGQFYTLKNLSKILRNSLGFLTFLNLNDIDLYPSENIGNIKNGPIPWIDQIDEACRFSKKTNQAIRNSDKTEIEKFQHLFIANGELCTRTLEKLENNITDYFQQNKGQIISDAIKKEKRKLKNRKDKERQKNKLKNQEQQNQVLQKPQKPQENLVQQRKEKDEQPLQKTKEKQGEIVQQQLEEMEEVKEDRFSTTKNWKQEQGREDEQPAQIQQPTTNNQILSKITLTGRAAGVYTSALKLDTFDKKITNEDIAEMAGQIHKSHSGSFIIPFKGKEKDVRKLALRGTLILPNLSKKGDQTYLRSVFHLIHGKKTAWKKGELKYFIGAPLEEAGLVGNAVEFSY